MPEQNTELLPCPFCGGNAIASDEFNEDGYWSTYCKSCKGMTAWFANKTASIIAWNTRTRPSPRERETKAEEIVRQWIVSSRPNLLELNDLRTEGLVDRITEALGGGE